MTENQNDFELEMENMDRWNKLDKLRLMQLTEYDIFVDTQKYCKERSNERGHRSWKEFEFSIFNEQIITYIKRREGIVPQKLLEQALLYYEAQQDYKNAHLIALYAGMTTQANELENKIRENSPEGRREKALKMEQELKEQKRLEDDIKVSQVHEAVANLIAIGKKTGFYVGDLNNIMSLADREKLLERVAEANRINDEYDRKRWAREKMLDDIALERWNEETRLLREVEANRAIPLSKAELEEERKRFYYPKPFKSDFG